MGAVGYGDYTMMGMFGFLNDMGDYNQRVIANFKDGNGLTVDTARCSDGEQPYETGIEHPSYHDGLWVIVEAYDTAEEAQAGHDRWVAVMTADTLPDALVDCQNAGLASFLGAMGDEQRYERVDD